MHTYKIVFKENGKEFTEFVVASDHASAKKKLRERNKKALITNCQKAFKAKR